MTRPPGPPPPPQRRPAAVRKLSEKDKQIELLTQERDNALLRIEELEQARMEDSQLIDEDRALILKLAKRDSS